MIAETSRLTVISMDCCYLPWQCWLFQVENIEFTTFVKWLYSAIVNPTIMSPCGRYSEILLINELGWNHKFQWYIIHLPQYSTYIMWIMTFCLVIWRPLTPKIEGIPIWIQCFEEILFFCIFFSFTKMSEMFF